MKKFSNLTLMVVVVLLVIAAPACRNKKNPPKVNTVPQTTESAAPNIPPPPPQTTDTSEHVSETSDFVKEDTPVTETFPADIEELNRYVQNKGYIRDAFFNYDEAGLSAEAQSALSTSATWLRGREGASYNLLVEGHCDERGTEQYNLALGDRRANTVRDYLVTLGVDAGRIRTVSYGEERPFNDGHDESAYAQNRRGHLVLVR